MTLIKINYFIKIILPNPNFLKAFVKKIGSNEKKHENFEVKSNFIFLNEKNVTACSDLSMHC